MPTDKPVGWFYKPGCRLPGLPDGGTNKKEQGKRKNKETKRKSERQIEEDRKSVV